MATFQIKNRWTGAVQFECYLSADSDGASFSVRLGLAARKAISVGADLCGANLRGADLCGANLRGADLRGADLRGADLCGANLRGADLRGADLRGADLCGANLREADLSGSNLCGADLRGANLREADLSGSNLCGADLRGADLSGSNLSNVKQDFLAEVLRLPNELEALRAAIVEGRIDGSTYSGECACLAGTLATAAGVEFYQGGDFIAAPGIQFHASATSPRESFFTAIRPGDTPDKNGAALMALEWTDEAIAIRDMIRATAPKAAA